MERQVANIILTGFSGAGKSLVAREVARRLNWSFIDTDAEIVELAGKPIAVLFQQDGESKFRELESETIKKACQKKQSVIAVGGGAIADPQNHELLTANGLIICLEATPETIYRRLFEESGHHGFETEARPLLSDDDPLWRIKKLKASRQPYYANADWTVHTDNLSIAEVADEVIRGWGLLRFVRNDTKKAAHYDNDKDIACVVKTATQSYPVFVGYGLLDKLGERLRQTGLSGATTVISDEVVFSLYGHKVEESLQNVGFVVNSFVVPPGEATKNVDCAIKIYDFLVEHRVERDDILIALGGGMIGDLAGFVAATFLRGMPWVQIPTSLVAMVDASIGGKVGVNHPQGKNLIGAFYQPGFVLADCNMLGTLPQRELTSGWAEVIKYGLIMNEGFLGFLESNTAELIELEPNAIIKAVSRSAAIKAHIVSEDERERGKRTILNYGHTIAHGLEAATQYRHFLHGEAVAIGMMGAAMLSQRLGLSSPKVVKRHQSILEKFNLPTGFSETDLNEVMRAMELDKKTKDKAIRWVLLEDVARIVIRSDVPRQDVLAVLQELKKL